MVVLRKPQAFGGLRTLCVAGLLTALTASGGCETAAGTGAAAGGVLGTGVGLLAGRGCPGAGLVGGLIGTGAGALGGAAVDVAREKKAQRAAAAEVAARAPSLQDIVTMTQNAVPPSQIIDQIRTSGVVYRLTSDQVIWLNQQGVNSTVISEMQATAYRTPGRVVYTARPVVQPVYVVEPSPPPVAVGVGVGFR
jgi:hypothetical protein